MFDADFDADFDDNFSASSGPGDRAPGTVSERPVSDVSRDSMPSVFAQTLSSAMSPPATAITSAVPCMEGDNDFEDFGDSQEKSAPAPAPASDTIVSDDWAEFGDFSEAPTTSKAQKVSSPAPKPFRVEPSRSPSAARRKK